MNPFKQLVMGAVRHGLQVGAGALVANGVIGADGTEVAIGAGTAVATFVWYLAERAFAKRA